ncbi:transposase [Methylocapsa aurea]|uniref:transposase n=1 Tax=Methylocapsa aurea TaxID=663610 RepID=UPI00068A81E0
MDTFLQAALKHRDFSPPMPSKGLPPHHWKTTICVAGLQFDEVTAPFVLDGPINRNAFETYMEKVPIPEIKPGVVVVTDNLSSHKRTAVSAMIAAAGQACFSCA